MGRAARKGQVLRLPSPNRWDESCAVMSAQQAADGMNAKVRPGCCGEFGCGVKP
jgi:hypothetical protein